ncbi:MAG: YraN family protein [Rhizomicrobium sp.]
MGKRYKTRAARGIAAERQGRWAEVKAVWLLRFKGYRIYARRQRTLAGEIDIIARSLPGVWCFIEVKNRPDPIGAIAAVSRNQRSRIASAAEIFLHQKQAVGPARFDVISVVPGRLPRHFRDAWRPDDA